VVIIIVILFFFTFELPPRLTRSFFNLTKSTMKKSILFFLLMEMTLFISCETQETVLTEQNKTTSIYNTAILDYFNNYKASLSYNKERTKKISALMAAIDYTNIKYFDLKTTEKLLVADLKEFNFTQNATNYKLILFVNDNKIARARLVNFESQDPFNQYDDLILSILNMDKTKLNYTGRVNQFDIIQNKEFSNVFSDGKLIENGATKNKVLNSTVAKGDCIDWYWITTYSDGRQTEEFLFTTCDPCDALLDKSANCGGGGSSGASNGAFPSFPPNPYDTKTYSFTSPDGVYTEYRYDITKNLWVIVINNLPDVVVRRNPNTYPKLVIIWPFHNQKVVSDGIIYTYDASGTGNWEGVLADDVILDLAFKSNPCLSDIYSKLGGSNTFQNYLSRFNGDFSVADLKLSLGIDPKYSNASAVTYEPVNSLIEIKFNPNFLNSPQLNIARTLIHELIHAEIYRELLSVAGKPNISWSADFINSIKDDFPVLADYYTRYQYNVPAGQQPTSVQHELMADHYRDIIIQAMKEFDPTQSNETYTALSWIGLMGSGKIDDATGLPSLPTVAWKNISQAQRVQLLNIFYNFRDTNPPCQKK
jgi:small nuclear ribonucleoprotein (snRNP)-like protein